MHPTAEETAYPTLLCERLVGIVKAECFALGALQSQDLSTQKESCEISTNRFLLDMLPRGKKYRPLVSEYEHYISVVSIPPFSEQVSHPELPPKAKAIHRRVTTWGKFRAEDKKVLVDEQISVEDLKESSTIEVVHFGAPRQPLDFVKRAVFCGHPRSSAIHLPPDVTKVLQSNLNMCDADIVKKRADFFTKWTRRAVELKQSEAQLKASMNPHLSKLLATKRLLLFEEILKELDFPDKNLARDISEGFPISGWMRKSGIFPPSMKRPQYDLETIRLMSKGLNASIISHLQSCDARDEIVCKTWELTKDEIDAGYVWIDHGAKSTDFILAKRFGLPQKNKIRMIDDCTIGGLNSLVGVMEKFKIHGMVLFIHVVASNHFIIWMASNHLKYHHHVKR